MVFVGVHKGYRVTIVMPEDMSEERKKTIKVFGGELILTPAGDGIEGCVKKNEELVKKRDPRIYVPQQFENPKNPEIHRLTTG